MKSRAKQLNERQVVAMFIMRRGGYVADLECWKVLRSAYNARPDLLQIDAQELEVRLTPLGRTFLRLKCGPRL